MAERKPWLCPHCGEAATGDMCRSCGRSESLPKVVTGNSDLSATYGAPIISTSTSNSSKLNPVHPILAALTIGYFFFQVPLEFVLIVALACYAPALYRLAQTQYAKFVVRNR